MRLAALYSVWNGLELLEDSINQIEPFCDYVLICWQHKSNKGEMSPEIKPFIEKLRPKRYFLIQFTPDLTLSTKQNERKKHQLMIDYARVIGATHFFFSATDHYYEPKQFQKAKEFCIKNDFDVTFTAMYTYYKHKNWRLDPIEDYFMPFICKIYPNTRVEQRKYPVRVDPSIQLNTCENWHLFPIEDVVMHHYSMIRVDIDNKFRNAAASIRWKPDQVEMFIQEYKNARLGDKISYFQGRILIEKGESK